MKKLFLLLILIVNITFGQSPEFIKDLTNAGFNPLKVAKFGNFLYFINADNVYGFSLWKTDGTIGGTTKVKEGFPPYNYKNKGIAYCNNFVASGGNLFFTITDTQTTKHLWKTDGTSNGTILLKTFSIAPSPIYVNIDSELIINNSLIDVNGTLFFVAYESTTLYELWKSDGTPAGTTIVKDISPNTPTVFSHSSPGSLCNFNGTLFFSGNDETGGIGLWSSDGTAAGTNLLKTISSGVLDLKNINGTMYFNANDGVNGQEIWKSNGTAAGTFMLKDLNPGGTFPNDSSPKNFIQAGGITYFTAFITAPNLVRTYYLWKTDGTVAGTVPIQSIPRDPYAFTSFNNSICFFADGNLMKSQGTSVTTIGNYYGFATTLVVGSTMYILTEPLDHQNQFILLRYDGSAAPTLLKNIKYANLADYENIGNLTDYNGTLYFTMDEGKYADIFQKYDGSINPVNINSVVNGSSYPSNLIELNNQLLFSASKPIDGISIWKSDGTNAGTSLVNNFGNSSVSIPFKEPVLNALSFNNNAYFLKYHGATDKDELWKTDGTNAGTALIGIFSANSIGRSNMQSINNNIYTFTYTGLFQINATNTGTVLVKNVLPALSTKPNLTVSNNNLFFAGYESPNSQIDGLWKSDGTAGGTVLVKNIKTNANSLVSSITDVNGTVFFVANDDTYCYALYRSDGTSGGTTRLKNFGTGTTCGTLTNNLTNVNGTLFFSADNTAELNNELWKSDGTVSGTVLVKEINPSTTGSSPQKFVNVNGTLFFVANNGINGLELWKSDGTNTGTTIVKDINPNGDGFFANNFSRSYYDFAPIDDSPIEIGGNIYFTASNGTNGYELWKSDGTNAGTVMIADINPDGDSYPVNLKKIGTYLYFSANDGTNGRELWRYNTSTGIIETIATGNWAANATWNTNTPPTATKTAKINAHTVSIPNTGNQVKTIQMNGGIINLNGGTLEIKNP